MLQRFHEVFGSGWIDDYILRYIKNKDFHLADKFEN